MKHNNFVIIAAFFATSSFAFRFLPRPQEKKLLLHRPPAVPQMRIPPLQRRRRLGARYELLPSKASLPRWMTRQRHSPLLEKKRRIRSRSPIRLSLPEAVSPPQ